MTSHDGIHPLRRLREDRGLTLRQWSALLAVDYRTALVAEAGYLRRPRQVFAALRELGYDSEAIDREIGVWWEARAATSRGNEAVANGGMGMSEDQPDPTGNNEKGQPR